MLKPNETHKNEIKGINVYKHKKYKLLKAIIKKKK